MTNNTEKQQILDKARKDSNIVDEIDLDILKNANMTALIIGITTTGLMLIYTIQQYYKADKELFANPLIFILQLSIISFVQSYFNYYYNKKFKELIVVIISCSITITCGIKLFI